MVIFGDHTRILKYIDFPFAFGADGIKILRPQKILLPKFFYYTLILNPVANQGYKRHYSLLAHTKILIPPLQTQKQIVGRLDKIAEAQKLNDGLIQKTEELFQSLLYRELNPASPADAKAMAGKKDWEIKELGEVALLVRGPFGGSLKKDIFVESGDCVYEQGNVIDNDLEHFRYFVTPRKFEQMKRFEVLAGDILMSCSGTIGRFVIIPRNLKKGIINQALLKITPNQKVIGEFLKLTLGRYFSSNNLHVKGIAIKNIAAVKELKKVKIPLPSLKIQKQIVAKLSAVQDYKKQLLEQKSKLKELFDSALAESMTSEKSRKMSEILIK
ncbi:MAG: DNA-methyltransferase, type I restriction-modification enzyme subunit M [Parcubacteria group bacterium Athens1014_26]|nr:MAG: DNA-methyltransferase, type I restriction-modification enzyme subunit M [Parcubacteria group bacterium Athens1014_26]